MRYKKKNSTIVQLSNIGWLSNITNMVPIYYASLLIWLPSNKQQLNLCQQSEHFFSISFTICLFKV